MRNTSVILVAALAVLLANAASASTSTSSSAPNSMNDVNLFGGSSAHGTAKQVQAPKLASAVGQGGGCKDDQGNTTNCSGGGKDGYQNGSGTSSGGLIAGLAVFGVIGVAIGSSGHGHHGGHTVSAP